MKVKKRLKAAMFPHLFPMRENVDNLVSPMESVACVANPIVEVVSS